MTVKRVLCVECEEYIEIDEFYTLHYPPKLNFNVSRETLNPKPKTPPLKLLLTYFKTKKEPLKQLFKTVRHLHY